MITVQPISLKKENGHEQIQQLLGEKAGISFMVSTN